MKKKLIDFDEFHVFAELLSKKRAANSAQSDRRKPNVSRLSHELPYEEVIETRDIHLRLINYIRLGEPLQFLARAQNLSTNSFSFSSVQTSRASLKSRRHSSIRER